MGDTVAGCVGRRAIVQAPRHRLLFMNSINNALCGAAVAALGLSLFTATAWSAERMEFITPGVTGARIAVPNETVIPNTTHPFGQPTYAFQTVGVRRSNWGDFNGDGLNDIVVTPSYFSWKPELPMQILANNGDGTFTNRTSEIIAGAVPTTGVTANIFVHDFNNDGRVDIFLVDHGLEDKDAFSPGFDGHANALLLSEADGKLHDRSATLPGNVAAFNHMSSMADVNGDGNQDIVMTVLGGPKLGNGGVYFLLGDGKGGFTRTTQGIPADFAFPWANTNARDWHYPGTSTVCDVDGDGRGDLITVSYVTVDRLNKQRNVRIHQQQADGSFVEKRRDPIPAAIAALSDTPGSFTAIGGYQIVCGKLTGGKFNDVLIGWENRVGTYHELLRNNGNYDFTDVTLSTFGTYESSYKHSSGRNYPINLMTIMDVDGDGLDDIWYRAAQAVAPDTLTEKTGFVYLNDGGGKFSPFRLAANGRQLTKAEATAALKCQFCDSTALFFDAGGSRQNDLVFISPLGDQTTGTVVQSKSITLTTLINAAPSRPSLKPGVLFSSGQTESRSYIRLNNTGTTGGTVSVRLADAASGQPFTQWRSPTIPAGASVQYYIQEIEAAIPADIARPSYFSATLQPSFDGTFQHVLWRPANGTITNLSTCEGAVATGARQLVNVHSTLLDEGYPSSVVVTNTGASASNVQMGIYDSTSGVKLGTYNSSVIAPNAELIVSVTSLEAAVGLKPGPTVFHYNIKIENGLSGFLQHLVNNAQVGVVTDMSTVCQLGARTAAATPTQVKQSAVFSTAQTTSGSYLRFNNLGATSGTVTVDLRNATTGQAYATWTSPGIAAGASDQFPLGALESAGAANAVRPPYFTISARATFGGAMQHALWRPADGTLTNLSTCEAGVTANPLQLINVHSSLLEYGYPSSVVVANTGAGAAAVQLGLYDARDGKKLGAYTPPSIPANGQAVIAVSTMEAAAGIKPADISLYHYNIKIEGALNGFLQHLVLNKQAGVITDMTTSCRLAKS